MSFLPTTSYYHDLVNDKYTILSKHQDVVRKRLGNALTKEFEGSMHGKEFVESLFGLRPVAGTVSVMYTLQAPVNVSDILEDMETYFGKDDLMSKLFADGDGKLSGSKRLSVKLGCWRIVPITENYQITEVLMSVIDKLSSSQTYDEDELELSDLIQPNELVGMDADAGEKHLMENGYRIVVRITTNTSMAICSTANFDQKRVTMHVDGNNVIQRLTIG